MPNRILKESICTSPNVDALSWQEEVLFIHLLVNCDDYGRFDARPPVVRARCFPLRLASISDADVGQWLLDLQAASLIHLYRVNGQPYLQVVTWAKHQQVRAKRSRFPPCDDACEHLLAIDSICKQPITNVPVIQSNPVVSVFECDAPAPDPQLTSNHLKTLATGFEASCGVIGPSDAMKLKDLAQQLALAHAPLQASIAGLEILKARGGHTVAYLAGILRQSCEDGSIPQHVGGNSHGRRTGKALPPTVGHFPQACTDAAMWAEAAAHEERLRKLANRGNGHGGPGTDVAQGGTSSGESMGQQPVSPPG